jgi:hypothetical protein
MGGCIACGHEYERHLFGGMCFYCDCKKAVFDTTSLVFITPHEGKSRRGRKDNGASPDKGKKSAPRLGNK